MSDLPPLEDDLPRMTLAQHLDELRTRVARALLALVVAMVVAFIFWHPIWNFVKQPFLEAARLQGIHDPQLMSIDPGEGFLGTVKLAFLAGAVLAGPVVLWQLWGFVAAGLYPHERRIVRFFFPVSLGLFALGVVLAYMVLIPFGFRFLIGWNVQMGVTTEFRIDTYVSTCLTMVFGMAVLFELPLVMLFLQAADLVQPATFKKGWRIAVLIAFVVGMFLTDPSPVTQVMMAMPVVGLYFLGIYGGKFVGPDRKTFRWYHAWPLVLGTGIVVLLLVYADDVNAWSSRFFGASGQSASGQGASGQGASGQGASGQGASEAPAQPGKPPVMQTPPATPAPPADSGSE
ncbi:MAG: twin-arginine translocase subunit TatC [Planctomycetota bacterium]